MARLVHVLEKEVSMTPAAVTGRAPRRLLTRPRFARFVSRLQRRNSTKCAGASRRHDPGEGTVADFSQGVQLAFIQALARYWATDYNWRRCEAQLNSHPQFITEIDGLDIHFIHVRSRHEDAMPLIVTHGWPGSPIEQLKIIDPLTNPTAHGASASDAFHVVIPSMAGYGFSGKPTTPGWDPARMARAWVELMKRLGYSRFAAQGGDWGGFVTNLMAQQAPPEMIGIHVNSSGAAAADVAKALQSGGPPLAGLSAEEQRAYDQMAFLYQHVPTQLMMAAHPQTLYGLADSPVALAAWMIDHDVASYGHIVKLFVDGEPTATSHGTTSSTTSPFPG